MLDEVLTDQLWRRLAPLLPPQPRRFRYPGRRPVADRTARAGTVCLLRTGMAGRDLPTMVGCFGVACRRRRRDWPAARVWPAVPERLLAELGAAGRCDLPAALVDAAHRHPLTGGSRAAPPRSTAAIPAASTT